MEVLLNIDAPLERPSQHQPNSSTKRQPRPAPENLLIHLAGFIALYRAEYFENNVNCPENLLRPQLEAQAARIGGEHGWIQAATGAVCEYYYENGHTLAITAGFYLHRWSDCVLNHGTSHSHSECALKRMYEAYATANEFLRALQQGRRESQTNAAYNQMVLLNQQMEEWLYQHIPSRPRATPHRPSASGVEFTFGLRADAQPFTPRTSTRMPGIDINLSSSEFAGSSPKQIRELFDQAVSEYEGTELIRSTGLTRDMRNLSIVRVLLPTPEDEDKVRKYQEWLRKFPGVQLYDELPYPVKLVRVNKLSLFSQPEATTLREDAMKIISEENGVNVRRVKWLGDSRHKGFGSAVIYLSTMKEAEKVMQKGKINIDGETAYTTVFMSSFMSRNRRRP